MTAATINSSTFSLFLSLVSELHNQIWHEALSEKIEPALYFYRKRCWCLLHLSRFDESYNPNNNKNNLVFRFRYNLLDDIQFEIPLIFINCEACSIALTWVHKQGIKICLCKHRQYLIFKHSFDSRRDVLYIALKKWNNFFCKLNNQLWQLNLVEELIDIEMKLTHIAVSEVLLWSEIVTHYWRCFGISWTWKCYLLSLTHSQICSLQIMI